MAQIVKDIALSPFVDKSQKGSNSSNVEALLPKNIDVRNMILTLNRNWMKRPGYSSVVYDLGENASVNLIIPNFGGYAVTSRGSIFKLESSEALTYSLAGQADAYGYRPTYEIFDDIIVIADGGKVVKIEDNESSILSNDAPQADIVLRVGNYTILMKRGTNVMYWSAAGNPSNWTTGDSGFTTLRQDGGTIQNAVVRGQHIYIFKDTAVEVWVNVASAVQFARQESLSLDIGIAAPNSMKKLKAPGSPIVFYDSNKEFTMILGSQIKTLSKLYDAVVRSIVDHDKIYVEDFSREDAVRWFEPLSGRTFRYDMVWDIITEENRWQNGWERLPIMSQAYLGDKCLIGSYEPNGEIYYWGHEYLDDNGQEIRCTKKYQLVVFETGNKARLNALKFRMLRGTANDSESAPKIIFRFRPGKGKWSRRHTFDLGQAYDQKPTIQFFPSGPRVAEEFEFEIVETDAVEFILTHMFATFEELGR